MEYKHNFTEEEELCIKALKRKGITARAIARTIGRDVMEVHRFIGSQTRQKLDEERSSRRLANGILMHSDPLAAKEGSRKLLEAVNAYLAKRDGGAHE